MCGCEGRGPVQGAIGPEVEQQTATRRNTLGTILASIGAGARTAMTFAGDEPSPQRTVQGIELVHLVDPDQVDASTSWPSLPGRLIAPSAWDGEPGAMAPDTARGWWA